MAKAETLNKVAKYSFYGGMGAGLLGPSFIPFVPILGGDFAAAVIATDIAPHAFRTGDFQSLNPFGGITFREISSMHPNASGGVDVAWHNVYHQYNSATTFDIAMGETMLALLAVAGVAKGASALMKRRR